MRISYQSVMVAASIILALPVSMAGAEDRILRVASYGGLADETIAQCVVQQYTQKTGVKVQFVDGNPTDHLAKLIATKGMSPPFDVSYLDDSAWPQGIEAGVFEKISEADVPNLKFLYPEAKRNAEFAPVASFYSIGLAYNEKILKEKGIPEPTSWADLWNPAFAGHVALPDISSSAGMVTVIAAAWSSGGDEKDVKEAFDKLSKIQALYYYRSSSDLQSKMVSGDAWIAPWYNGRAWALHNTGFPLKYIYPKPHGMLLLQTLHVSKGTTMKEASMQFIDAGLAPESQICIAKKLFYAPTNMKAAAEMQADPKLAEQMPGTAEVIKSLYMPDWGVINKALPQWTELWNRKVVK